MHYINTDHENPAVQALIDAALAVDEQLPGAWSRVAEYLETYNDKAGVLGRRKLDGDGNTAELRAEDLHVLIGALETVLDAHTGPDEPDPVFETLEFEEDGVGLADLDAKLDELLNRTAPKEVYIKLDGKLSAKALAKLKDDFLRTTARGRPVCDTDDGIFLPPALATGGVLATRGTATAQHLIGMIEDARIGDAVDWEAFTTAVLADPRLHREAEFGLTDVLAQLRRMVEVAQDRMGAEEPDQDGEG